MDEILQLRHCLEERRYNDALLIIGEMEEMAKDEKIDKIGSYVVIMLIHLIKEQAEKRTTRLWELTLRNAVMQVQKTNRRRKADGFYLNENELREVIEENYPIALNCASLETFGGVYSPKQLAVMINQQDIGHYALNLILYGFSDEEV